MEEEQWIVQRAGTREHFACAEDQLEEEQRVVEMAGDREHSAGAEWQGGEEMGVELKMEKQHELLLLAKMW